MQTNFQPGVLQESGAVLRNGVRVFTIRRESGKFFGEVQEVLERLDIGRVEAVTQSEAAGYICLTMLYRTSGDEAVTGSWEVQVAQTLGRVTEVLDRLEERTKGLGSAKARGHVVAA